MTIKIHYMRGNKLTEKNEAGVFGVCFVFLVRVPKE